MRVALRSATPLATTAWAALSPVYAQQSAASGAPLPDSSKAVAERKPYEDRIMEGVPPQDELDPAVRAYNAQGWPRGISLQLTRNLQTSQNTSTPGNKRVDTQGVQIDGYVETPNFGALSLHARALGGRDSGGLTSWSLRQTGLPFDGGWRADNAVGATNLFVPELARRNSRLTLPSPQVLGGSTIWRNEGSNAAATFGASVGEPGRFEGFPQSRFVGSGGQVNSLFAQATQGQWTAAAALAQGSNILPDAAPLTSDEPNNNAARISPRGFYVSAARNERTTGASWQASAIASTASGVDAMGLWADVNWRDAGHRHQASIFRFEPGLSWIDRPLAADLQGGSYRYHYLSLRWDLSANIESFASVSGQNPDGWYASASGRRLLTSNISTGGGFALRRYGVSSASGFGYLQWQNPLGLSRLQLDAASTQRGQSSQAVTVDHSVYADNGLSLSTSLSIERLRPAPASTETPISRQNAVAIGLSGRAVLTNSVTIQGSLRARDVTGGDVGNGTTLAANIALDWQISRDWSLGASIYANRGTLSDTVAVLSPLVVPEIVRARPSDYGVFLMLRYVWNAGAPSAVFGGPPGSGTGRIEGSVYLDSNGNGQRDGNESGVANVLVLLDGKFSTRTNAFGDFEFPAVVSGQHTLSVLQDDLPLPWTLGMDQADQKISAPVSIRNTTRVDIGAKRLR